MIDTVRLKQIRKKRKLIQKEVAQIVGIAGNYYSEIETGKRNPAVDTLVSIAKALGVTVNDLLIDCGATPPQPFDIASLGAAERRVE
ncbi:MAG: helix-turn-helix domain-containing protein [Synergistaceae bacterium]|jgi:transcriptional regulator with XRE-family HTH domain|nr:helix-turn-helix domain-containing protein [Synergistaceae bacterium]